MPLISVGLPVFNGDRFLEQAISSVLEQTHEDLELVISDNASTDGTERICRAFAERDSRVVYIRQEENRGASFNHNTVAELSRGEYFRWFAADDWMAPTCLAECLRAHEEHPGLALAWPRPTVVDEAGEPRDDVQPDLTFDNTSPSTRLAHRIGPHANDRQTGWCYPVYGLARRTTFIECLPLLPFHLSDQVVLARLALRGPWRELPQDLFFTRSWDGDSTTGRMPHEVATWFDPHAVPDRSAPYLRRYAAFIRAVARADLPLTQRVRCAGLLVAWPFTHRHLRLLLWDVKVVARSWSLPRRQVAT